VGVGVVRAGAGQAYWEPVPFPRAGEVESRVDKVLMAQLYLNSAWLRAVISARWHQPTRLWALVLVQCLASPADLRLFAAACACALQRC
jgi:hypothetical protein